MKVIRTEKTGPIFETIFVKPQQRDNESWVTNKYHLSDSVKCIRRIVYRIRGLPMPEMDESSQMILEIGKATHDKIQRALVDGGFVGEDALEVRIDDEELNLCGSADVVIRGERLKELLGEELPGGVECDYILEFKTKGDKTLKDGSSSFITYTKDPTQDHLLQVQGYMEYLNVPWSLVIYINKNTGEQVGFWIEKDSEVGREIKEKAREVKGFIERGELPPRPFENKRAKECWGFPGKKGQRVMLCPFWSRCWEEKGDW